MLVSSHSEDREEPTCRICMGDASDGKLFSPCHCKGTMRYVHVHCLQRWRQEKARAPSYYRCDQCHYEYNLKRVDAASTISRFAVPVLTVSILAALIGSAGLLCWTLFPLTTSQIYPKSPVASALVGGVGAVGIISFLASIVTGDCGEPGPFGGPSGFCRGGACHHIEYTMGDGVAVICAYAVLLGLLKAVTFTYAILRRLALGGAHVLETTVLDIGEAVAAQPPVPASETEVV